MANVLLAWNNVVNDEFVVYNDGWWNYAANIYNLAKNNLSLAWVSVGLTAFNTRFTFGVGSTTSVAMVGLCSHNMGLLARVRIQASNVSDFSSTVYNSGSVQVHPTGVTEASSAGMRKNFFHKLTFAVAAQYWRVEVTNDGTNPDGYIKIGRLFVGTAVWQPTINMLAGASLGWESNAEITKALSGAEWISDTEAHRVFKFGLQIPESEALSNAFDLQRVAAGSRREVVAIWDSVDGVHSMRRSMFGRLRTLSAIEAPYYATSRTAFEIKELL